MKIKIVIILIATIFFGTALASIKPQKIEAAYPYTCASCRSPGSYCVEDGTGYHCGSSYQCGNLQGYTPDCPANCTCRWAPYSGGSLSCGNNCIAVVSCIGTPTPTPTPTPLPTGTIRGMLVLDGSPARCPGCSYSGPDATTCNSAHELNSTVTVTNPNGGSVQPTQCTAAGPGYEMTTTAGSHTVSVNVPSYNNIGYTYCINDTSCHTNTPTPGSAVTVEVPPAGFVDLWWHYSSPGTLKIKTVSSTDICPALLGSTSYYPDALGAMRISGVSDPGTVNGTEKIWINMETQPGGKEYTMIPGTPPIGFTPGPVCYQTDSENGSGNTAKLNPGGTVTWLVGFIPPVSWTQTTGGDVYAFNKVISSMPDHTPPHMFSTPGNGGMPGVVVYGTDFDFDSDPSPGANGASVVSDTEWLAHDAFGTTPDYYSAYYTLLGSPTTPNWSGGGPPSTSDCDTIPCYASGAGPYSVTGSWNIPSGKKMVILVNDNLSINTEIHVADGGFLAFIVHGNITVADGVGTTSISSEDPQIEGVYIASGGFNSGSGTKKLVAEGMYIAGSFNLDRDFEGPDNVNIPAELFLYGPRFLVTMPSEMFETLLRWEEVNP